MRRYLGGQTPLSIQAEGEQGGGIIPVVAASSDENH